MRQLAIHGKADLREESVPTPEPGAGQVRLRMAYAGICGSDLHYFFNGANGEFVVREPLVPGHEVSGVVDLDPSGELAPGTPVTVHPATFGPELAHVPAKRHLWPGGSYLGSASTWPHTQGGMAELLVVRKDMVRVLPDGLPLRRAALAEPLAVGLHAIALAGGVSGKRVLVSGSGPIGLLLAAAAVVQGAAEVTSTDVLAEPLQRARTLGVQHTVQVGEQDLPVEAYDVVFECSGVPAAISPTFLAVRRAGVVVQVGMVPNGPAGLAVAPLISKEVEYRGCFRFDDEIDDAVQMLEGHPELDSAITHVLPAHDAVRAFTVARDSRASGKVLISLWQEVPER